MGKINSPVKLLSGMKHQGSSKSSSQGKGENKNLENNSNDNDHEINSNDFKTPKPDWNETTGFFQVKFTKTKGK